MTEQPPEEEYNTESYVKAQRDAYQKAFDEDEETKDGESDPDVPPVP